MTSKSGGSLTMAQTMLNITYQKLIQYQQFVEVTQICRVSYLYCEEGRSVETTNSPVLVKLREEHWTVVVAGEPRTLEVKPRRRRERIPGLGCCNVDHPA